MKPVGSGAPQKGAVILAAAVGTRAFCLRVWRYRMSEKIAAGGENKTTNRERETGSSVTKKKSAMHLFTRTYVRT